MLVLSTSATLFVVLVDFFLGGTCAHAAIKDRRQGFIHRIVVRALGQLGTSFVSMGGQRFSSFPERFNERFRAGVMLEYVLLLQERRQCRYVLSEFGYRIPVGLECLFYLAQAITVELQADMVGQPTAFTDLS
ncbi:hypothetical protein DDE05_58500 [Streptomyces cavourensis]|nr:hypothetical protein DDE05_58500 [Streptomyces cavourensis]